MTLKRSLKVIQISTTRKLGGSFLFAFHMAVSLTVYEIFSIKV